MPDKEKKNSQEKEKKNSQEKEKKNSQEKEKKDRRSSKFQAHFQVEKDDEAQGPSQPADQRQNQGHGHDQRQSQAQDQHHSQSRRESRVHYTYTSASLHRSPSITITSSPSTSTIADPEDQFNKKLLLIRLRAEQEVRSEPIRSGRKTLRRSFGPINRTSLFDDEPGQEGQKSGTKNTLKLYSSSRDHRPSLTDISAGTEESGLDPASAARKSIGKKISDQSKLRPQPSVSPALSKESAASVGQGQTSYHQSKRMTPTPMDKPVPLPVAMSRFGPSGSGPGSAEPDADDEQNFWLKPLLAGSSGYGQYETRMDDPLLENVRSEIIPRDRRIQINVIPADVIGVVEQGVKWWEWNRVMFLWLFGTAVILYIAIATVLGFSSWIVLTLGVLPVKKFLVHSSLMTVAMLGLGAIGLLIYRLFPEARKSTLSKCHAWIFVLLFGFLLAGYGAGFEGGRAFTGVNAHLFTLHSYIGIGLAVLLVFEAGSGVYMYWKGQDLGLTLTHKKYDTWVNYHTYFGFLTFALGGLCCITGYMDNAGGMHKGLDKEVEEWNSGLLTACCVLSFFFVFTVVHMASTHRFAKRSKPEWDTVFGRSTIWEEDLRIDDPGVTLGQWVRDNFKDGQRYLHDLHYHHHNFYTN